ncbi:MAG: LysM peptidoglycan-binding domain-containing protein [Candidatus Brocadiales bacterium]
MVEGRKSIIRRWETQVGIGMAVACFSVLGVFLGLKIGGKEESAVSVEVAQVEGIARVEEAAQVEDGSQVDAAAQTEAVSPVEERPAGIPDLGDTHREEVNALSGIYGGEDASEETEGALLQGHGDTVKEALEGSPAVESSPEEMFTDEGAVGEGVEENAVVVSYPKVHRVKPNETLMGIAKEYYGEVSKWVLIYEANGLLDRNRLVVGQDLEIPSPDYVVRLQPVVKKASFSDSSSPGMAHRVQHGDTLRTLAKVYYDDESKWKNIYDANKGHLSGRETLEPGEVIIIP